jgi:hypothetical protein
MSTKLNTLLAKTDQLASGFKEILTSYIGYFKNHQGAFKGERRTYSPRPGTIDEPKERANDLVVTTVAEKFAWLVDTQAEYIDALFSQEATNAAGIAKARLVVDGLDFGEFSSLELLRLKSLLEGSQLVGMYEHIPVRTDSLVWRKSSDSTYAGREVWETELISGVKKTTVKEAYILPDPNIKSLGDGANYQPMVAQKDTVMELGDFTHQRFSGEFSHKERADILYRRQRMLTAVLEALKASNEVESVSSEMTAKKLFGYLHEGKLA